MANLQVKDIPDAVHRRIRRCAERRGQTLRDFVLAAVDRELSHEEFVERLRRRKPVKLGRPAARFLTAVREERERAR